MIKIPIEESWALGAFWVVVADVLEVNLLILLCQLARVRKDPHVEVFEVVLIESA